jgi:hypothetical protein
VDNFSRAVFFDFEGRSLETDVEAPVDTEEDMRESWIEGVGVGFTFLRGGESLCSCVAGLLPDIGGTCSEGLGRPWC